MRDVETGINCRCAWECLRCRLFRVQYTGCLCPGCAPAREVLPRTSSQTPFEFARTLGIVYRQSRYRICDARKVVLGELVSAYENPYKESINAS